VIQELVGCQHLELELTVALCLLLQLPLHAQLHLQVLLFLLLLVLLLLQAVPARGACGLCTQHLSLPSSQHALAASRMCSHGSCCLQEPAAAPCHGLVCTLRDGQQRMTEAVSRDESHAGV
jgi:hypothetical protein